MLVDMPFVPPILNVSLKDIVSVPVFADTDISIVVFDTLVILPCLLTTN